MRAGIGAVGTEVIVTRDDGSEQRTRTSSEPWALDDGTEVILLDGITGGYLLDRVRPAGPTAGAPAAAAKPRGIAGVDRDWRRRVSSAGGTAAHAKGTAHEFTKESARAAGHKGGKVVSQNREHMAQIGRKGAQVREERRKAELLKRGSPELPEGGES